MKIWHPKYGVIYDEFERMKKGVYKKKKPNICKNIRITQVSMF
jgi:hypothetical protein